MTTITIISFHAVQDPYNNIVRTTVEGMAAIMGKPVYSTILYHTTPVLTHALTHALTHVLTHVLHMNLHMYIHMHLHVYLHLYPYCTVL